MAQIDRRGWINGVVNDEEGRPITQGTKQLSSKVQEHSTFNL